MVSRITMQCKNRNCQNSIPHSNHKLAEAQKLNGSVILGGLASGIGRRGLEILNACMEV